jgi:endonuclease/exonuclease/phosphatase (EEP) superfamily protein YafD
MTRTFNFIGDFYLRVESLNNATAQPFLGLMEGFGLTHNVDSQTFIGGHTLDFVYSRGAHNLVSQTCVKSLISDHYAVRCYLSVHKIAHWKT